MFDQLSNFLPSFLFIALFITILALYRRFLSRRRLMARIVELENLRQAGGVLVASTLDVEAMCELIYEQARSVVQSDTFQVGLFYEDKYVIPVWVIDGERRRRATFDIAEDAGIVGWVRENKQSLLVGDFKREMDTLPAQPRYVSDSPPRSGIFIPLISGDDVLGIIATQSQKPYRFDEQDQQRLTIIANQAAAAIANARLFDQERKRATQMSVVNHIAQQVNASRELDDIFQQVVTLTAEAFNFQPVNIFAYDEGTLAIRASSAGILQDHLTALNLGQGLVGTAFATKETIVANNVAHNKQYIASINVPVVDAILVRTQSEIAIPLIAEEQVFGVLDVQSSQVNAFSPIEQSALEALAAQVATAIFRTRQNERQREQAWLTTAQLQAAEAISQSDEMDELLTRLTYLAGLLMGAKSCAILLWDEDWEAYVAGGIYEEKTESADSFSRTHLAIGSWSALDAVHVGHESIATQTPIPWLQTPTKKPETTTLYPLLAKGALLGVMTVSPPPTTPIHREMFRNFSTQTGLAIDSIQLDVAQQEEAWVNTVLLQVAEAVNMLTDVQDILSTIVRFVPMLVGVRYCIAVIYDEEKGVFYAGPSFGLGEMERGLLESFEMPQSELPILTAHEDGLYKPSPTYYEVRVPKWLQKVVGESTVKAFPLTARSRLVGSLLVGASWNERPLSGRRMNIIAGIAHQAAIALVNDQLYQEAAERQNLARELEVAHQIQASLIPNGSPALPSGEVASLWQAARQVSGDFYDFIPLKGGKWGIVVADVADKGMPAAIFMAVSRTILRAVAFSRTSPAEALTRTNQILLNDTHSDLFITVFMGVWDAKTNQLTYASAGHNPAVLVKANGEQFRLQTSGIALGVIEPISIQEKSVDLDQGDVVIFYTDGITEAINEDYDEFGFGRLCLTAALNRGENAGIIVSAIEQAVQDYVGDTPQFDDMTMVVFKRK